MAPVEIQLSPSLLPAGITFAHLSLVGSLSLVAVNTIYRSYLALPPSSATRHREPLRRGHVHVFSGLAAVSLVVAFFFSTTFAGLSYRVWAAQRGVGLPESFFGDNGALRGGEHPGRLHFIRWLSDTNIYQDMLEIVAEKARYFWWGQQVNVGLTSWSMYLAIEGRRRNISNLWAFLTISQLVNLSYAQNLFFLAVLLTPVPLPENVREITRASMLATSSRYSQFVEKIIPTKPNGFLPKPALYIVLLLVNFISIFLIPFASNTPSFMTVSLLSRALPFSFLALPYVIPTSWGTIHTQPHSAHNTYTTLFRTISAISALLHLKSTVIALFYNTPESYSYRHSLLHPFKVEHHSAFNRSSTAIGRLFGAIGEHPAISAAGSDVILSGLSLGIWSAVRGLDAWEVLGSSMIFMKRTEKTIEDTATSIKEEAEKSLNTIEAPSTRRRSGRPKKNESTPDTDDASTVSVPKRRGRSSKKQLADEGGPDDTTYQPSDGDLVDEGDEDVEEDWEAAALAWGMIITGGLGKGSADIYGAEMRAR